MTWLTQPNEQKRLLNFLKNKLKNKPKDIKFNYPENKPVFSIYKFKKEKSQTPADDIYVIFPHKTRGDKKYNLHCDDNFVLKARKKAFKDILNHNKDKVIAKLLTIPSKKTYTFGEVVALGVLNFLQNAKNGNLNMDIALKNQYKIYNLMWHESRRKINLALFGFQIKSGKLAKFQGKLCIKKMCYSKENMEQEIKYMKMFGCYAGYEPQRIDLNDTAYRIVILMKYLGERLNKHTCFKSNNNKIKTRLIYEIALEIKKMHDKDIVHGDLKPANITLDDKAYTIDYDNAGPVGSLIAWKRVKRAIEINYPYWPLFIFKEFVKQSRIYPFEAQLHRTKAFDIFSLGIVIWEIYGGNHEDYQEILRKYKNDRRHLEKYTAIDGELRKLITQDLQKAKVDAETIRLIMRMVDINQCDVPSIDDVIKCLNC